MGKNIFLVRHSESQLNVKNKTTNNISYNMCLTKKGEKMAHTFAITLKEYLISCNINEKNIIIYFSPAKRCKQTAEILSKEINVKNMVESLLLYKQCYGIFTKPPREDWNRLYPDEYEKYIISKREEGNFFTKMPFGESGFDVYTRLCIFMEKIKKVLEDKEISEILIVTHSSTIKILTMILMNFDLNWYEQQESFPFGEIRHIILDKNERKMEDIKLQIKEGNI